MAKLACKPWPDPQGHSKHHKLQRTEKRTISIITKLRRVKVKPDIKIL